MLNKGNIYETEAIGDVVQSLEVYNNKLIVLINNSHKIKIYDITAEGLSMFIMGNFKHIFSQNINE